MGMISVPSRKTFSIPDNNIPGSLGIIFGEMEEVRRLLLKQVKGISQEILDYTPDINKFETIGTQLFHIADVENSWIFEHIDGEQLDYEQWKYAFGIREKLDPPQLTKKPLDYYLTILNDVREKIKDRIFEFKEEDAKNIFSSSLGKTTLEWVLFHIHQHESHHIGQINLNKRLFKLYNSNK
jgi:uncharacterized damage-inducible protein DinB